MSTGAAVVTADGINAIVQANATGGDIKPKYFRFSSQDLTVDPMLSAADIDGWRTQDISQYRQIDNDAIEFTCDVLPTEATEYTRFCGLYLEDGTLYAVAKPPFAYPPQMRQTLKIPIAYQNLSAVMNFQYLSNDETEQYGAILSNSLTSFKAMLACGCGSKITKVQGVSVR